MRSGVTILLVLCQFLAGPLLAGAWLKEEGRSFLSSTFSLNSFRETASETYFEYGFRSDITLGFDVGLYAKRRGLQTGHATAFLRRPIGGNDGASRFSYELGIGADWVGAEYAPHLKTGLSWGRGITIREKSGWMNVDASIRWDLGQGRHLSKVDTTIGLNFTSRTTGMLQIYFAHADGESYTTLAPSIVFSPRTDKFRILIGALAPMENLDDTAIKVGLWRSF